MTSATFKYQAGTDERRPNNELTDCGKRNEAVVERVEVVPTLILVKRIGTCGDNKCSDGGGHHDQVGLRDLWVFTPDTLFQVTKDEGHKGVQPLADTLKHHQTEGNSC